jgi:hypothetical protein
LIQASRGANVTGNETWITIDEAQHGCVSNCDVTSLRRRLSGGNIACNSQWEE